MFSEIASKRLKELKSQSVIQGAQKQRLTTLDAIKSGEFATAFAKWVNTSARNEKDEKVIPSNWLSEWCLIHGDLRLSSVAVGGAAQVCKSLSSYLLNIYATEVGNLSTLYCFSKSKIRDKIVGSTVTPIREANRNILPGSEVPTIANNQSFVTPSFTSYYSYVNSPNSDVVAVPSELASISVDFILCDEYSQMNPSIVAVLTQRQANSKLESRPFRYISTPGRSGTGIDLQLQKCNHVFEAHTHCENCGGHASLNPLKALFKQDSVQDSNGDLIMSYFDSDMRMVNWNYTDEDDKINSAFLACHLCGHRLPDRVNEGAFFLDTKTGLSVADFHAEVNASPDKFRSVGIVASPLLRRTNLSIAQRLVNDAMTTENNLDYVQQTLGLSTNDSFNGLTIEQLSVLVTAPKQPKDPELYTVTRVIGIDIARSNHYYSIVDCFTPKTGTKESKYRDTIRSVVAFGTVATHGIDQLMRQNKVDNGGLDLNPDQSLSLAIGKMLPLLPFVQKHNLAEVFRLDKAVQIEGKTSTTISINNQYFINQLIRNFSRVVDGELIIRLPIGLQQYINHTTKSDPIAHLLNMEFDEQKSMWQKGQNNRSDYFYALLFAELRLYYNVFEKSDHRRWLSFF